MRFHPRSLSCGLVAALAAIAAPPSPAQAQQLTGSVFGGPAVVRNIGNHDSAWQAGGGAERLAGRFGFGGEARYVYFPKATRTFEGRVVSSSPAVGAPAVSFRGAYYWPRDRAARLQPFVSAGLTYLFD